jgi:chromosome segregation ATPase
MIVTSFLSFTDCAKQFKGVKSRASGEETEKSFTEQLIEELRQREEEATQAQQQADVKLLETKKLASQYQKEADKCSSGMDTCEEAREKSAEALIQQKKLSAMWEQRARELGWKPGNMKSQRR